MASKLDFWRIPLLFALADVLAWGATGATASSRPNLLIITIDTCRADRLGCYGFGLARTPSIDALAHEGVVCTNAITTAPITLVAHASIMTGLLPPAHGIRDNGAYSLADGYETLAEVLKANGYSTSAFVSAVVLAKRYNLSQGFDTYDDDLWAEDEPKLFMIRDRPAPRTAERAVAWLRANANKESKPFFLWVHFFDPHQPYESRYRDRHLLPTPYDAEIAQADEGVGAIIDCLRGMNCLDSTFVVLTADHGESLGEHGEKTHAIFVYDATVHVPLLLRYPSLFPKGRKYEGPVRCVDIFPTVLSGLQIAEVPRCQGANLVSPLKGEALLPELPQYSESLLSEVGFGMAPLYAVRVHGKKYIRAPKPEFYDLVKDPREQSNLFSGQTVETGELDATLQTLLDSSKPFDKAAPKNPLDAETLETLRALGYVAPEKQQVTVAGLDPKDGMALYNKLEEARHAAQRQDYAASEKLLREVLDVAPNHVTARNVLGLVLVRRGRLDDAKSEYLNSLSSDPTQARVLHMLGVLSIRQNDFDHARAYCERALELSPNLVESIVILGFIASQKGDTQRAEEWYRKALAADPALPRAQLAYADLFYLREKYPEALAHYRKVLEVVPNHFSALIQAGLCSQRSKQPIEAKTYFEKARDLRPDSWLPLYDLACLKAQAGDPMGAISLLDQASMRAPDDTDMVPIIQKDPDLLPLRQMPEYDQLLNRIESKRR